MEGVRVGEGARAEEGVRVVEGVRVEEEVRAGATTTSRKNQSGTPDGEGLKKCATTGLYEPPPHRGKKHPS